MTAAPSKSKKDKHAERARLDFDAMETYLDSTRLVGHRVQDRYKTTVAATAKEVYIDKRLVKWENVLSMEVFPSGDDDDDENGVDELDFRPESVEYGLELRCREQKQDRENYVPSDEYKGPVRIYKVVQDVHDSEKRSWTLQWNKFHTALQCLYNKELNKRERRAEREREEKRAQRGGGGSSSHTQRTYARRSTYSKREAFLNKNRKNIASNATLPDAYDDDDDEFMARYRKGNETTQETLRRLKDRDEVFAANPNTAHTEVVDQGDEEDGVEAEWTGDAPVGDDVDEEADDAAPSINGEHDPMEEDEDTPVDQISKFDKEEKHSEDEKEERKKKSSKALRSVSSKKKAVRKIIVDDDSDDDENLFGSNQISYTTPSSQRVVSPGTTGISRKRRNVLQDDDSDEEDNQQVVSNEIKSAPTLDDEEHAQEEEEDPAKGIAKITSFFAAGATTAASKKPPVSSKSPARRPNKSTKTSSKSIDSLEDSDANEITKPSQKTAVTQSSKAASDFFAPRKPKNASATKSSKDFGDMSDASTVVDSMTPSSRRHPTDFGSDNEEQGEPNTGRREPSKSSLTPSRTIFGFKRKSFEEEDPIVDVDSSQSPPGGRRRLTPRSRLVPNKKLKRSIAFEALEIADRKSSNNLKEFMPVSQVRPFDYYSAKARRPPLSPNRGPQALKLNFESMVDDTPVSRWRGLYNDGNTCYVNSSLQALFSVKPFMEAIRPKMEGHPLVQSLVNLWGQLKIKTNSTSASASARDVKTEIDKLTDRFVGFEQRDAHEFLGEVMDAVHEELKEKQLEGSDGQQPAMTTKEPTDEFFRLDVRVCLTCESCGYFRSKDEMYKNLSLDITSVVVDSKSEVSRASVKSCLASFFQPELREIKCEKCKEGRFATQQMKILSKPKALLLHLKRFIVEERPANDENDPNRSATELIFRKKKVRCEALAMKESQAQIRV